MPDQILISKNAQGHIVFQLRQDRVNKGEAIAETNSAYLINYDAVVEALVAMLPDLLEANISAIFQQDVPDQEYLVILKGINQAVTAFQERIKAQRTLSKQLTAYAATKQQLLQKRAKAPDLSGVQIRDISGIDKIDYRIPKLFPDSYSRFRSFLDGTEINSLQQALIKRLLKPSPSAKEEERSDEDEDIRQYIIQTYPGENTEIQALIQNYMRPVPIRFSSCFDAGSAFETMQIVEIDIEAFKKIFQTKHAEEGEAALASLKRENAKLRDCLTTIGRAPSMQTLLLAIQSLDDADSGYESAIEEYDEEYDEESDEEYDEESDEEYDEEDEIEHVDGEALLAELSQLQTKLAQTTPKANRFASLILGNFQRLFEQHLEAQNYHFEDETATIDLLLDIKRYGHQLLLAKHNPTLCSNIAEHLISNISQIVAVEKLAFEDVTKIVTADWQDTGVATQHAQITMGGMDSTFQAMLAIKAGLEQAVVPDSPKRESVPIRFCALGEEYFEHQTQGADILQSNGFIKRQKAINQSARHDPDILMIDIVSTNPQKGQPTLDVTLQQVNECIAHRRKQKLDTKLPVTLVIDTTAKSPEAMQLVYKGLQDAVNAGYLNVVFAHSGQKYDTFGFGVCQAGSIITWHNGNAQAKKIDGGLGDRKIQLGSEQQMYALMLQDNFPFVQLQIKSMQENAKQIFSLLASKPLSPIKGLTVRDTFVTLDLSSIFSYDASQAPEEQTDGFARELSSRYGIPKRDSFAFFETSMTETDGTTLRISAGVEDQGRLFELFYAISHCKPNAAPKEIARMEQRINRSAPYYEQKKASLLLFRFNQLFASHKSGEKSDFTTDSVAINQTLAAIHNCLSSESASLSFTMKQALMAAYMQLALHPSARLQVANIAMLKAMEKVAPEDVIEKVMAQHQDILDERQVHKSKGAAVEQAEAPKVSAKSAFAAQIEQAAAKLVGKKETEPAALTAWQQNLQTKTSHARAALLRREMPTRTPPASSPSSKKK